ncbi:hypothetical protein T12_14790 [Trichinella patagoniensis]|uniref:Uncharacterized protein n=1 Tax=Trichinella patagoniensis TaxID=990121 RepID=A0A0V0Z4K5_9BILA|nr:hypothetical protein T12_14790 [Trichinella patagoniensis]
MSYCFKRDVTKLQTIKMKIDRIRRKENHLGCVTPQQSIQGLKQPPLLPASRTAVGSCLSSFRESLLISSMKASIDWVIPRRKAPQGHVLTRRLCVQPLLPPGRIARWFGLHVDAGRGTARSATLLTPPGRMCPV